MCVRNYYIMLLVIITGCHNSSDKVTLAPYEQEKTELIRTATESLDSVPTQGQSISSAQNTQVTVYNKSEDTAQYNDIQEFDHEPKININLAVVAKELKDAAEQGDVQAQYELGHMYLEGSGVPENPTKAAYWFKKASEKDLGCAQFYLGIAYLHIHLPKNLQNTIKGLPDAKIKMDRTKEEVSRLIRLAYPQIKNLAVNGNAEAQFILARMYMGILPDIEDNVEAAIWRWKAIQNYEKAAQRGSIKAQRALGRIYSFAPVNEFEQMKWYKKAAEKGDPVAQYHLSSHYKKKKYYSNVVGLLKQAAQKGHIKAQYELASTYMYIEEVKDCNEAIKWYTRAAEQGYHEAQHSLAVIYSLGEDVPKNPKESFKWWQKLAPHGDQMAQSALAQMYYYGKGVDQNYEYAFKWYKEAAEQGHYLSQYSLGRMYYRGESTTRNYRKAAEWYIKAAEHGYDLAQYELARMYYRGEGVIQDYVQAYKWAILAAAKSDRYYGFRDTLKEEMTKEQIAEAQKAAKEFYNKQSERVR
ncbi:MAG: sel1 repeat family protein [Planctomycetes bacterium]|nr:sel1 repeat family protein [Planctomycetota bacterium]MBL7143853.1 sel1 repeat family protein [Phycisphaerae bacterium]